MEEKGFDNNPDREAGPMEQNNTPFDVDDYQKWTQTTAGGLSTSETAGATERECQQFLALALCGEAGEVAEKLKKAERAAWTDADEKDPDEYRYEAVDELGDVLWYIARLADELDVHLSTVFEMNQDKLEDRVDDNTIVGEGDER